MIKIFSMHILKSFSDEITSRFLQSQKKSIATTYAFLLLFMNAKENCINININDISIKIWISWLLRKILLQLLHCYL